MKKAIVFLTLIFMCIVGCNKTKTPIIAPLPTDYRDAVEGTYSGIRIETAWTGVSGPNFSHDTFPVIFHLTKSQTDSEHVNLSFDHNVYEYRYIQNTFSDITAYHPSTLRNSNDSLYFNHQPALGPRYTTCIVKKQP